MYLHVLKFYLQILIENSQHMAILAASTNTDIKKFDHNLCTVNHCK